MPRPRNPRSSRVPHSLPVPLRLCALRAAQANGVYGEGEFALNKGWVYYVVIMNVSVGYAFYCLGCFYIMLHGPLEAHNPVPKFLCIKAVLFLSFWQVRPNRALIPYTQSQNCHP